jgi:hypothetical protein
MLNRETVFNISSGVRAKRARFASDTTGNPLRDCAIRTPRATALIDRSEIPVFPIGASGHWPYATPLVGSTPDLHVTARELDQRRDGGNGGPASVDVGAE